MFRKRINKSLQPAKRGVAGKHSLGRLSDGTPFARTLFTITLPLLVCACGKTPMTLSGTISLGEVSQEVTSCSMSGRGAELTLNLLLKEGASVILPIHESIVLLKLDDKSSAVKLSCAKHSKVGGGSGGYYAGDISLSSGAAQTALMMKLHIECGNEPSFSNTDPDEQGSPR